MEFISLKLKQNKNNQQHKKKPTHKQKQKTYLINTACNWNKINFKYFP